LVVWSKSHASRFVLHNLCVYHLYQHLRCLYVLRLVSLKSFKHVLSVLFKLFVTQIALI